MSNGEVEMGGAVEKGFKNRDLRLCLAYFAGIVLLWYLVQVGHDFIAPIAGLVAVGVVGAAFIGELTLGVLLVRAAIRYYRSIGWVR